MSHLRVAPKDHEGYKGSPDHFMLRAYTCDTCVLKSKSNQGCTHPGVERLQGSDPTRCCCKYTTACCRIITRRDSPKGHCNKGLVDNLLLRAHTCVLQSESTQSCTEGQGIQRFGRPNAAGGIHMCSKHRISSHQLPIRKSFINHQS